VKPVRMIVPYAAGGPMDTVVRIVIPGLGDRLGQPFIIDNRGGAGGTIGAELGAKAPADGYTLTAAGSANLTLAPSLYSKLQYDPMKDFAPVSRLTSSSYLLVVHPSVQSRSLKDLVALAKAKPGQLNYASSGVGSMSHLSAELFKAMAGLDIVNVAYKGTAPAVTELVGGQVSMMFSDIGTVLPHVKAGKLIGLGTTGTKRSALAPAYPTVAEAGLPGFEVAIWYGIVAPRGTPASIIARLNEEVGRALKSPEVRERLSSLGFEADSITPQEFKSYIDSEFTRFGRVIRDAGIKAN
jgi:tripartite-type tricarboxylate transporter receptor subunit TctC